MIFIGNNSLFSFEKITVLTHPVAKRGTVEGHKEVTRSLLAGLRALNVTYNYNPSLISEVGDVIIVLANTQALQQAIEIKKMRPQTTLLAGPNLVVWPIDDGGVLTSSIIDRVIVPSEPTRHMYAEISPNIKNRIGIWYAGIDAEQWSPRALEKGRQVLLYWKNQQEGPSLKNQVLDLLRKYQWDPILIEYGKYSFQQYRNVLDRVKFGIFLSRSESQGIALAEAWGMDVVTLPWNPQYRENRGRVYSAVSSCPYLSSFTGRDWQNIQELELILKNIDHIVNQCYPRRWLLDNMTDKISTQKLIDLIEKIRAT